MLNIAVSLPHFGSTDIHQNAWICTYILNILWWLENVLNLFFCMKSSGRLYSANQNGICSMRRPFTKWYFLSNHKVHFFIIQQVPWLKTAFFLRQRKERFVISYTDMNTNSTQQYSRKMLLAVSGQCNFYCSHIKNT